VEEEDESRGNFHVGKMKQCRPRRDAVRTEEEEGGREGGREGESRGATLLVCRAAAEFKEQQQNLKGSSRI